MPLAIPTEAQCPKNVAHDFRVEGSYPDATVEVCSYCSKRMIWKQDDRGRMDSKKYLRAHFRSFVQPHGITGQAFALIWGEKKWREAVKDRPHVQDIDWEVAASDAKAYLRNLKKEKAII